MDAVNARDRLTARLDAAYFKPILDIDPQTVAAAERDAFITLQEAVRDSRERIRDAGSAEDLVRRFEEYWHSDEAVEARRGLARLGHPVAPKVRDDLLALARELGVPTRQTPPPVVTGAPEAERRIRERARRLWQEDGRPVGREDEYLERARELEEIAENPQAALMPNPQNQRPGAEQPVEEVAVRSRIRPTSPGS